MAGRPGREGDDLGQCPLSRRDVQQRKVVAGRAIGTVDLGGDGLQRAHGGVLKIALYRPEEGPGQVARLLRSALDPDITGPRMVGMAVLLAARGGRGKRLRQRPQPPCGQILVTAQVLDQQIDIDAGIKVIDARAEGMLAKVAGAGVLVPFLQVIDGGKPVVLGLRGVGGDGMAHLHRRLAVVFGIIG